LEKAIETFESHLKRIQVYKYPGKPKRAAKKFYLGVEKNDLPLIVSVTTRHLEKSLTTLEHYHHDLAGGK